MTSQTAQDITDRETRRSQLAARLATLQDAADTLAQQITTVKAEILDTTDGPDTYTAGPLTVVVTQAMRLDPAEVAAKYPPDRYPELYDLVPSTKKIRAHLAPVDLEPLQKPSKPSVSLR